MKRRPKIEFYLRADGDWAFRLKAASGEILAAGEGYKTRAGVLRGIAGFLRAVAGVHGPEQVKH
jgi:hypothetical protein